MGRAAPFVLQTDLIEELKFWAGIWEVSGFFTPGLNAYKIVLAGLVYRLIELIICNCFHDFVYSVCSSSSFFSQRSLNFILQSHSISMHFTDTVVNMHFTIMFVMHDRTMYLSFYVSSSIRIISFFKILLSKQVN